MKPTKGAPTPEVTAKAVEAAERAHMEAQKKLQTAIEQLEHIELKYDEGPTVALRGSVIAAKLDLESATRLEARAGRDLTRAVDAHRTAERAAQMREYEADKAKLATVRAEVDRLAADLAQHERAACAVVVELARVVDEATDVFAHAEMLAGDLQVQADFTKNVQPVDLGTARDQVRALLGRLRAEEERPTLAAWLEDPSGDWHHDGLSSAQIAEQGRARADQQAALDRSMAIARDKALAAMAVQQDAANKKPNTEGAAT